MMATNVDTTPVKEDNTVEQGSMTPEFVILAYNVPQKYTVNMLQELLESHLPNMKDVTILPTYPWENRIDWPRKILCKERETQTKILEMQDIWVKSENETQASQAITFVNGDANDIPYIPFTTDEKLLMDDQTEQEKTPSVAGSSIITPTN